MREEEFWRRKAIAALDSLHSRLVKYRKLRIDIFLSSPPVVTHPWLHLDSVLMHVLWRTLLGDDYYIMPSMLPISRFLKGYNTPPGPIRRWKKGIPQCSVGLYLVGDKEVMTPYELAYTTKIYKRFEDKWALGRGKITRGSGYFRDYMITQVVLGVSAVRFYCVGDPDWIDELMHHVAGLGDNIRIGWGFVKNWRIEEMSADYSFIRNGKAMRPLPVEVCLEYEDAVPMSYRPPYWAPENVRMCVPPGARCRLNPEVWRARKMA